MEEKTRKSEYTKEAIIRQNLTAPCSFINAHLSTALKDEFIVTLLRNFDAIGVFISMRLREQSLCLRLLFIVEPCLLASRKRKALSSGDIYSLLLIL